MHPILFKLPLPNFNLAYAWIPLIIAALAVLVVVAKMVGKDKDRGGAIAAGVVAIGAVIARFTVMKDNTESWNVGNIPIYSYGVMLGLSLVVGWYLTLTLAERDGLPKETMANNYVVTAIAAVVGRARPLHPHQPQRVRQHRLHVRDAPRRPRRLRRLPRRPRRLVLLPPPATRSRSSPGPTSPSPASPRG